MTRPPPDHLDGSPPAPLLWSHGTTVLEMTRHGHRICPTCGQPELSELLDEVEDSVDAFFDDIGSQPLRIELDEEEGSGTSIAVSAETVTDLEGTLSGIAHALNVLRGTTADCPEDLSNLLDALARDASTWSRRLARLRLGQPPFVEGEDDPS